MYYSEYDNDHFFSQYARMDRSRGGLEAAGEWHQLRPLFPDLKGKGIDLSEKMLMEARQRNSGVPITYRECAIEDYEYPESRWDCVVSNLALHYVSELSSVFRNIYRTLTPGGVFLMNIEHPVFTAGVNQDWLYHEDGTPKCWPVDDYFRPGQRETRFLGCTVRKYHHTLTQILMGLLEAGFRLTAVEEAQPLEAMLSLPGMADELRRPMMLLVRAEK